MELPSPLDYSLQSVVLTVLSYQVNVMESCFILDYESTQNSTVARRKLTKRSNETSSRCCFCSIVSKRGSHLSYSFLTSEFLVDMRCTALLEMPTMSASSRTFSRTISWVFFTISGGVTSFDRPPRCSFRSRLNSANQYFIVANEGADSPRIKSSSALKLVRLRPSK